jgi:hypothetical protein
MKKILTVLAIWGGLAAFIFVLLPICHHEETATTQVRNEIERAIEVKGLKKEFVYMEGVCSGGAGAGGMGLPTVICESAEQFARLVPETEPVYVVFGFGRYESGTKDKYTLKKIYWSFIENRAGIMVYEDIYTYTSSFEKFWAEKYDRETIYWRYDNFAAVASMGAFIGFFWVIFGLAVTINMIASYILFRKGKKN